MKGFLLCESCIHVSETGTCIRYGYVGHRACSYVLPLPLFCVGCELKIRGSLVDIRKGERILQLCPDTLAGVPQSSSLPSGPWTTPDILTEPLVCVFIPKTEPRPQQLGKRRSQWSWFMGQGLTSKSSRCDPQIRPRIPRDRSKEGRREDDVGRDLEKQRASPRNSRTEADGAKIGRPSWESVRFQFFCEGDSSFLQVPVDLLRVTRVICAFVATCFSARTAKRRIEKEKRDPTKRRPARPPGSGCPVRRILGERWRSRPSHMVVVGTHFTFLLLVVWWEIPT